MKRSLHILLPVLLISALVSCNGNPFMTNLFSNIDQYELPTSFSSAADVLDESGDDQFLDALADDPALADDVITLLDNSLPADPADYDSTDQEAALLIADIYLAKSGADDTINNVNSILLDVASGSSSMDMSDPLSIIPDLFPSGATVADVADQLTAMLGAASALADYGSSLDTLGPSVEANSGTTAGTALLTGVTNYLILNMDDGSGGNLAPADAINTLADFIVNGGTMPTINDTADVQALPPDAPVSDYLSALLGAGLTGTVNAGFDLTSLDNM